MKENINESKQKAYQVTNKKLFKQFFQKIVKIRMRNK